MDMLAMKIEFELNFVEMLLACSFNDLNETLRKDSVKCEKQA